jgi:hypothetical protein
MIRILFALFVCVFSLGPSTAIAQQSHCEVEAVHGISQTGFQLAQLPESLQTKARRTLQDLLDHEGLYTLFSDLKPMSTGYWNTHFAEAEGEPHEVRDMKQILRKFEMPGRITAGVLTFNQSFDGKKYAEAYIANIPVLKRLLIREASFFNSLGLVENSSPQTIIETVDRAEPELRFRGFGLLFGYPEHAVEFFVEAHKKQQVTGKFVERDFFHVETFSKEKGAFVWAVPKGHVANERDLEIRRHAEAILERYRSLREICISHALPIESLVKHWFEHDTTSSRAVRVKWNLRTASRKGAFFNKLRPQSLVHQIRHQVRQCSQSLQGNNRQLHR